MSTYEQKEQAAEAVYQAIDPELRRQFEDDNQQRLDRFFEWRRRKERRELYDKLYDLDLQPRDAGLLADLSPELRPRIKIDDKCLMGLAT